MNKHLDWLVNMICEDWDRCISDKSLDESHLLLGGYDNTLEVMRRVYDHFQSHPSLSCHWTDELQIKAPFDFYEPILRRKYGTQYEALTEQEWFKECVAGTSEKFNIHYLANLCAQEKKSEEENRRKVPIIFIDGIEKLFFKFDCGRSSEEEPIERMFERVNYKGGLGTSLRSALHQAKAGVVFGLVKDPESMEYALTLGNYDYLFYDGNFRMHHTEESVNR